MARWQNYNADFGTDNSKELAFDLRQALAKQLSDIRERIIEARLEKNYPQWYDLLDCLFIEISKKLDDKEMKEFEDLMRKANRIITENSRAYANKSMDGQEIYLALREMDIWLNRRMEQYDMFGSKAEIEDF